MKHLREKILFALDAGDVERLAELLGQISMNQTSTHKTNDRGNFLKTAAAIQIQKAYEYPQPN